ncbi:MAG: lytic transglycosylase domain-containing protein, partial [Candidatus Gastranaerophilaceae bacterium]
GYFKRLMEKYPDSYYSYRASKAGMSSIASWSFSRVQLPDAKDFSVDFPFEEVNINDVAFIKLFFELGDTKILEEIPLDNLAVKSWCEYKKGNAAKSVYYANKYITDSNKNIPYSNSVWKLAFPIYYSEYINENSLKRNIDPFLILSLIREESHFIEDARSSSNAMGLMQLMMPTATYIAELKGIQAPDGIKLNDPKYNIELGTAYFSYVLDATSNNTMYAIGGYNGGPNAMNKWVEKFKIEDTDEFVEKIPYPESKYYIKKVFRSRYNYAQIYGAY